MSDPSRDYLEEGSHTSAPGLPPSSDSNGNNVDMQKPSAQSDVGGDSSQNTKPDSGNDATPEPSGIVSPTPALSPSSQEQHVLVEVTPKENISSTSSTLGRPPRRSHPPRPQSTARREVSKHLRALLVGDDPEGAITAVSLLAAAAAENRQPTLGEYQLAFSPLVPPKLRAITLSDHSLREVKFAPRPSPNDNKVYTRPRYKHVPTIETTPRKEDSGSKNKLVNTTNNNNNQNDNQGESHQDPPSLEDETKSHAPTVSTSESYDPQEQQQQQQQQQKYPSPSQGQPNSSPLQQHSYRRSYREWYPKHLIPSPNSDVSNIPNSNNTLTAGSRPSTAPTLSLRSSSTSGVNVLPGFATPPGVDIHPVNEPRPFIPSLRLPYRDYQHFPSRAELDKAIALAKEMEKKAGKGGPNQGQEQGQEQEQSKQGNDDERSNDKDDKSENTLPTQASHGDRNDDIDGAPSAPTHLTNQAGWDPSKLVLANSRRKDANAMYIDKADRPPNWLLMKHAQTERNIPSVSSSSTSLSATTTTTSPSSSALSRRSRPLVRPKTTHLTRRQPIDGQYTPTPTQLSAHSHTHNYTRPHPHAPGPVYMSRSRLSSTTPYNTLSTMNRPNTSHATYRPHHGHQLPPPPPAPLSPHCPSSDALLSPSSRHSTHPLSPSHPPDQQNYRPYHPHHSSNHLDIYQCNSMDHTDNPIGHVDNNTNISNNRNINTGQQYYLIETPLPSRPRDYTTQLPGLAISKYPTTEEEKKNIEKIQQWVEELEKGQERISVLERAKERLEWNISERRKDNSNANSNDHRRSNGQVGDDEQGEEMTVLQDRVNQVVKARQVLINHLDTIKRKLSRHVGTSDIETIKQLLYGDNEIVGGTNRSSNNNGSWNRESMYHTSSNPHHPSYLISYPSTRPHISTHNIIGMNTYPEYSDPDYNDSTKAITSTSSNNNNVDDNTINNSITPRSSTRERSSHSPIRPILGTSAYVYASVREQAAHAVTALREMKNAELLTSRMMKEEREATGRASSHNNTGSTSNSGREGSKYDENKARRLKMQRETSARLRERGSRDWETERRLAGSGLDKMISSGRTSLSKTNTTHGNQQNGSRGVYATAVEKYGEEKAELAYVIDGVEVKSLALQDTIRYWAKLREETEKEDIQEKARRGKQGHAYPAK